MGYVTSAIWERMAVPERRAYAAGVTDALEALRLTLLVAEPRGLVMLLRRADQATDPLPLGAVVRMAEREVRAHPIVPPALALLGALANRSALLRPPRRRDCWRVRRRVRP